MITNNLRGSVDRPQEYVLVPFNDPFVYDVTHTRDANVFKRALRRYERNLSEIFNFL